MPFPQLQDNSTQSEELTILKETCFTVVFIVGILFGKLLTPDLLLAENKEALIGVVETEGNFPTSHDAWAASQATGAPNTFTYGDHGTAWASNRQNNQEEWLQLRYEPAVKDARMVMVFQTYNPGALVKMNAAAPLLFTNTSTAPNTKLTGIPLYPITDVNSPEAEQWNSVPKSGSRELEVKSIPINVDYPIETIKLTIASQMVPGWNEIDAVGIVDAQGKFHWAKTATASSSYADRNKRPSITIRTTPRPSRYPAQPSQAPVTREEFQKLTEAIEKLSQEVKQLKESK